MTENVVKIVWPSHHQHLAAGEDMFVLVRQIQKQHGVFYFQQTRQTEIMDVTHVNKRHSA